MDFFFFLLDLVNGNTHPELMMQKCWGEGGRRARWMRSTCRMMQFIFYRWTETAADLAAADMQLRTRCMAEQHRNYPDWPPPPLLYRRNTEHIDCNCRALAAEHRDNLVRSHLDRQHWTETDRMVPMGIFEY